MSEKHAKILLLVEGERLEKGVFEEIGRAYNLKCEIFCLQCNIFMLYNVMKSYDFNVSIKTVLSEKMIKDISDEDAEMLRANKFAYTYIIMDLDLQHYQDDIPKGLKQVAEMCKYFSDETDDTIGKLYVNYPMMESIRDRDGFIDDKYNEKIVNINDFTRYKSIAGSSKLSSVHLSNYGKIGFDKITISNINKAITKIFKRSSATYNEYLSLLTTKSIYERQRECIEEGFVYVLNTAVYFIVDYFGKKYYDQLFNIILSD